MNKNVLSVQSLIMDAFSKEEIRALLAAAKAHSTRDWLMILVTFNHGLRESETLQLTRHSVEDGWLTVRRLKGSLKTKQELFDHPDSLLNERAGMFEFVRMIGRNQRLFPISHSTFWRRMQKYGKLAGLPRTKLHAHALKHSCAMQLIDSAGIHRTQAWLGHKSMASTGKYLKPSDADVAQAAKKALGGFEKV